MTNAYPIIPLTPTWGNTENQQADVAKTKYGDAGIEQRDYIGINPLSTSWDINVNVRNFLEIDAFLRTRNGKPFRLSLDGVNDDGKFYICTEWQMQQPGVGVGNFTAKFSQVRRAIPVSV
jgi:phage-related protein